MDSYITSNQLKASLSLTGETYADADISLAIEAASAQINEQCNRRTFSLDPASSTRVYRPIGRLVEMDDAVSVTDVVLTSADGAFSYTLTAGSDYEVTPLNAALDDKPYELIRMLRFHEFGRHYHSEVQVTGTFGWPAVPVLVQSATSLLAARLVRRIREAPFGVLQMGLDGQPARIAQSDPDICAMLMPVTKLLVR